MGKILSSKSPPSSRESIFKQAEKVHELGISVLPAFGKRAGLDWAWFNHERMSMERFRRFDAPGFIGINGRVSGNLITLDYETREGFEDGLKDCWKWCGATWATRTFKGGHIKYLLPHAVQGQHITPEFEIRGHKQYAVCAPSPHPDGGWYEDITPPDFLRTIEDVPFLSLSPAEPDLVIPNTAKLIYYGHETTLNCYRSDSEATMAFICGLLQAGFDDDFIKSSLSSSVWMNSYRKRQAVSEETAQEWLKLSLCSAGEYLKNRVDTFQDFLTRWRYGLSLLDWVGSKGNTEYKVAYALSAIAERAGRKTITPSTRQIAETATTHYRTVSKALPRLADRGLLTLTGREKATQSKRITLTLPEAKSATARTFTQVSVDTLPNVSKCAKSCTFHPDPHYLAVWEFKALGASARIIFEAIQRAPLRDYAVIAAATKKSLRTVKSAMPKLVRHELVQKGAHGYEVCDFIDWAEVARKTAGIDRYQQRVLDHVEQRARNQQRIERKRREKANG